MQRSGQDPPQTCTIGTSARAPTTASPTRHHTAHIYSSFHRRSKSHVTAVLLAVAFERLRRLVPRHRRDIPTVPVLLYHAVHVQGFEKHGIVLIYMSGRGLRGTRRACSITARTFLLSVVAPPDSCSTRVPCKTWIDDVSRCVHDLLSRLSVGTLARLNRE
jgi:hypothetical protein